MKKFLLAILLIACILFLTGCRSIDYGVVTDKRYTPSHTIYRHTVMIINKQTRVMPRWIRHSEKWQILVENEEGSGWWDVSESFYNSVNIGDTVDRRKGND